MAKFTSERIGLVKGYFDRSEHPGPVTDMLVKPLLTQISHPASSIKQPLSGMIAAKTAFLKFANLPNDFGVDLAVLLAAYDLGWDVAEAELPLIEHKTRPWSHYVSMAIEVISVFSNVGYISGKRSGR